MAVSATWGRFFSSRPQTVETALLFSTDYAKQYHASTIAKNLNGDLVVCAMGGTSEGAADQDIWMTTLPSGASSWTTQTCQLRNDRSTHIFYNPVLFQLPASAGGDLLLFYGKSPYNPDSGSYSYGGCVGQVMRSSDGGATWGAPLEIGPMSAACGPDKNPPILVGNRLIAPSAGSYSGGGGWVCHYDISDDYGYTWRRTEPLQWDMTIKPCQPSVFQCTDGRIRSVMRTKTGGHMATCYSDDNGETWSKEVPVDGVKNNNAGLCAISLADGRYALVYDDCDTFFDPPSSSGPRWPLTLALSVDGVHWVNSYVIEPETGGGRHQAYEYPTAIADDNGDILMVYSYKGEQNNYTSRGNIKFARIRL